MRDVLALFFLFGSLELRHDDMLGAQAHGFANIINNYDMKCQRVSTNYVRKMHFTEARHHTHLYILNTPPSRRLTPFH